LGLLFKVLVLVWVWPAELQFTSETQWFPTIKVLPNKLNEAKDNAF
jgi:hypothetical protein